MAKYAITYDEIVESGDYRKTIIRFILENGGLNLKYVMKTTVSFTSDKYFTGTKGWKALFETLKPDINYYAMRVVDDENHGILEDSYYTNTSEINSFNDIRDAIIKELKIT